MHTVLTIAGSDSSGGAGIQADIKTMCAHGIYATTAITALTSQNTTGITGIMEVQPEFLAKQLDSIFTDIFPDAIKIGMLCNEELIQTVVQKLIQYKAKNIVLDPVMISTSGTPLIAESAVNFMKENLFPIADLVTPNIPEAEKLCSLKIQSEEDMVNAGSLIVGKCNTSVLVKGGHNNSNATDVLITKQKSIAIKGKRINTLNTHGTGCTLSSAIACNLAMGKDLEQSVMDAKQYLTKALLNGIDIGKGSGPLNHLYNISGII